MIGRALPNLEHLEQLKKFDWPPYRENYKMAGSRTAVFFELLKFCEALEKYFGKRFFVETARKIFVKTFFFFFF